MKKTIPFIAIMFLITAVRSQATLSFCTYVDAEGYCSFNNNKFITTPDSANGKIYMQVKSTDALGSKLIYKIYTIERNGEEKLSQSLDQGIKPDWLFAWYPYVFGTNAKYAVKVFNDADKMICSKSFELVAGSK